LTALNAADTVQHVWKKPEKLAIYVYSVAQCFHLFKPSKYLLVVELPLECSTVVGRALTRSLRLSFFSFFGINQWPDHSTSMGNNKKGEHGQLTHTLVSEAVGYAVPRLIDYSIEGLNLYQYLEWCNTLEHE